MRDFYISMRIITINNKLQYYVQYWWNTNLRTDSTTDDIPIMQISEWLGN